MGSKPAVPGESSYYALRPQKPRRAWVIAAALFIIGAITLYKGLDGQPYIPLVIIGFCLAGVGLLLMILAIAFRSARTLHVVLSPNGFEVSGPGYHRAANWSEVTDISATPDGARLVISCGRVARTYIQSPGGVCNEQLHALTEDLTARLQHFVEQQDS